MRKQVETSDPDEGMRGNELSQAQQIGHLFQQHNAALLRFLRLRVKSDQEARDIAQEAYLRLLQLHEPGAVRFLRAYLFEIANNLATDRLRKLQVRVVSHADPAFDLGMDELGPDRHAVARQQLSMVQEAIDELPAAVRTAFLLRRIDGLSTVEIGRQLGVTERSAHNYVVKAMVHCRKRLDEAEL